LDTTPIVEEAATSLREIPSPLSSSDAGMSVPLVHSTSLPPPPPALTPPVSLLPIVYPRPSRQFGWPVAVGLVLIGMVGVLIVALVQRATASRSAASPSAKSSTSGKTAVTPAAGTNADPKAAAALASVQPAASATSVAPPARGSSGATSDAVPVEKLERLPPPTPATRRVVPPHHGIAPIVPRTRPTGTGGGDSFDPESL
jgi:hypothetical protein